MESVWRVAKKNTLLQTQNSLKVDVLKVDKDLFIDKHILPHYIANILQTCKSYNLTVQAIKMSYSKKKGMHFYIQLDCEIDAELANLIQLLLGDDPRRVVFNSARIKSGLAEWNKLFELPKRRQITLYRMPKHD